MRLPALVICFSLWLLGAPAGMAGPMSLDPDVLEGFQRIDLSEAKAGREPAGSPLDGFSLDLLATDRGQVVLDNQRPLRLDFTEPQMGLVLAVSDPREQATLALSLYRGDYELGRQVFAYRPVAGSRMARIEDGRIAIVSDTAFDRIELRRVDFATQAPALRVDALWLPAADAAAAELKGLSGNIGSEACIIPLAAAYTPLFFLSLSPDPVLCAAGRAAYFANLGLKFCKPGLIAPDDVTRRLAPGQCAVELDQPHMAFGYQDALGIPLNSQSDWGDLGTPRKFHHNTDVDVMLLAGNPAPPSAQFTDLGFLASSGSFDASDKIWEQCDDDGSERYSQLGGVGPQYECPYAEGRTLSFPVGHNTVVWRANPRISPVDLLAIPICGVPSGAKTEPFKTLLKNIALETVFIGLDAAINGWRLPNARTDTQSVIVYDEVPPTITPLPGSQGNAVAELIGGVLQVTIEADEVGGVSRSRYEKILRSFLQVSDSCDRPTSLNVAFPSEALRSFWPVSTETQDNSFEVTWTARDPGPNLAGLPNETTRSMRIAVLDRQPPTLIPPPDIVEVDTTQVTDLGQPAVFDLVDLSPQVSNDAVLPLGLGLHQVTWTAVDSAGNSSNAVQIVNIKASNVSPVALAQTGNDRAEAVSFEPTLIRLSGSDPDGDPLRFKIEDRPDNGFFVAPLYPYFIEDFRIEQSISDSELLALCTNGQGSDRNFHLDFPSEPEYLSVTDDGSTYVVDKGYVDCRAGSPVTFQRKGRIAVFGNDGSLLNARNIDADQLRDVVLDPGRERIFLTSHASGGQSSLRVYDLNLQLQINYRLQNLRNRSDDLACNPVLPQPGGGCTLNLANSGVVDDNGLIYVMNRYGAIIVLDGSLPPGFACEDQCSHTPSYVGVLNDDGLSFEGAGRELALDAQGRLYAGRDSRVYRYLPSFVGQDALAYPGTLDGWLGRCDIDLAAGDLAVCDVANHRSLGFSCTDETCAVHIDFNPDEQAICDPLLIGGQPRWGCRPGQFRGVPALDLAPDGTLYVADSGNARIQRFSPDGFFAGQAKSTGAGSGFVIGDFGNPQNVSVNSSRFYVLDPQTNLLHISLLTPFVEIGNDYADLVYQSNNQFACQNSIDCIDRFSFRVSDGVRDPLTGQPEVSAPAQVEVEVSRNFRAPFATPGISIVVLEDTSAPLPLDGSDPDPLDSLSYEIVTAPSKGAVLISGQNATYVPNANAWGDDSFSFRVSDGVFESAPEIVNVEIIEINDAPIISVPNEPIVGGTGYRLQLDLAFRDPDPDENHTVVIDWGDGSVEPEGGFDAEGNPTGPILAHGGTASGRISASHIYTTAGMKAIEVCVTDRMQAGPGDSEIPTPDLSLTSCETIAASIADGIDLGLSGQPSSDYALPGQLLSYEFQIENRLPQAGLGLTASGVELAVRLASGFDLSSLTLPPGCNRNGLLLFCSLNNLAPGQSATLNLSAEVATGTAPESLLITEAEAFLDQTAVDAQTRVLLTTPVLRPADFRVGAAGAALNDDPDANPGDGECASAAGVCTLRAAIEEAAAAAAPRVIALANGLYLLNEALEISSDITLIGNGPDRTRIHGARLITRPGAGAVHLENLTLSGGGVTAAPADSLTIHRVRFTDNEILASFGGAIQTDAALIDIRNSTFDNNRSTVDGGSLMCFSCSGVIENVTVTGGSGGGLTFTGSGQVSLTHVSIVGTGGGSGWEAPFGAALHVYDSMDVSIANSVLAGNYSTGSAINCAVSANASLISLGNNAFGDLGGCALSPLASDLTSVSAELEPLATERQPLPIRRPKVDSPLTDAFNDASCLASDARGVARPMDGNDDGFAACDIGAVERMPTILFLDDFES